MSANVSRLAQVEDLLTELAGGERLAFVHRMPARSARYGLLERPVDPALLASFGLEQLWCHQAEAVNLLRDGGNVVVATGTASGKSLCYQMPIAESIAAGAPPATALCIFPTKALAQDQLRSFTELRVRGLVAATYDGDTSPEARGVVRRSANVLLTNPEMLHSSMLPYHGRWADFLRRLRFVVVDELHVLRGVFGGHMGHVLRRLRRLCALYGSDPTFVFSSATIGDPAKLAGELCGQPVAAVTDDGSPRGERLFLMWNPALIDPEMGIRASSNAEVSTLVSTLVENGWRTVAFCRSRRGTETVTADIKRHLPAPLAGKVRPYRAGFLASERREIEAELFDGRLMAVVATSALELGIDVGGLDACVLNGFPGTLASMWQQAGRAGRRDDPAVIVLVAGQDQLDQWFMQHPREVFSRPIEPAVVNLSNPQILMPHLACAAFERPLRLDDEAYWGDALADGVRDLVQTDRLRLRDGAAYWQGRGQPANGIGLRSGSMQEFQIREADGRLVGTVDGARAFDQVHPGAIYLHLGQQYRVIDLDLDELAAIVETVEVDEYTQVRSQMDVSVLDTEQSTSVSRADRLPVMLATLQAFCSPFDSNP